MRTKNVSVSAEVADLVPDFKVLVVEASVQNFPTTDELWNEIRATESAIRHRYKMEEVRHRPAIDATRRAYKAMGKEPNRYRPSAEALCRRAVKGLELYRTLTIIDLINLLSMETGVSIGGFDMDKISGDDLVLGIGKAGEEYTAIGRGELNIEGLPVYRDAIGGIGTPTSDHERTKLTPDTHRLLMTINLYGQGEHTTEQVEERTRELLCKYANASDIETYIISAQ